MDEAVKIRKRRNTVRKKRPEKRGAPHRFLYLPEVQCTKPGTAAVGYMCRALTAWIAVWGVLLFICDAFLFEASAGFIALASLVPVAILAAASSGWLGALIAFGATAVSAALYIVFVGKPIYYTVASMLSVYNGIGNRLSTLGYRAPIAVQIKFWQLPVGTNTDDLIRTGLVFIAILLAVVVTLSAVKRVHMLPIIITGGAICIVIFTYNLVGRSWGFTLMLTALCGLLVMRAYENFFREAPEPKAKKTRKTAQQPIDNKAEAEESVPESGAPVKKARARWLTGTARSSALGGFAALAAMIVAFLVLFLPTLSIRKKWQEIESINSKMDIARQILSSVIVGDVPDFSDLGYLGKMDLLTSRSTTASDRLFTGAKVLEIRTNYNTPLYLRSFVSDKFENDRWLVPQSSTVDRFFENFGRGFVGERISKDFFDIVSPKLSGLASYTSYSTRYDFGFVTTPVDIKFLSSNGNLLFLPSRYDPDIALLSYGGAEDNAYDEEYVDYTDGIMTTSWLNFNKSYRALTYVQTYRHENVFKNLELLRRYYRLCREYIERTMNEGIYYGDTVKTMIAELGFEELAQDNAYERWYAMDEADRATFYKRFTTADSYNRYVYDFYTDVPEPDARDLFRLALTALSAANPELNIDAQTLSEGLQILGGNLYVDLGNQQFMSTMGLSLINRISVYDKVMAVIDYLKDNYVYTLSPKEPSGNMYGSIRTFLLDTKEGYCVQFASAAALMLRTLGIPTRYCEGYIAPDFKYDKSVSGEGRYVYTVRDYNAHAWIEVYINDIGWLTFETTPEYYSGMYQHFSNNYQPNTGNYETPEYPEPEEIDIDDTDTGDALDIAKIFGIIALGLMIAAALGTAAYFVYKFAAANRESRYRREKYIQTALNRAPEGDQERRYTALAIIDYITAALAAAGLRPRTGELPSEYRERIRRVMRGEEPAKPKKAVSATLPAPLAKVVAAFAVKNKDSAQRKADAKKAKKRGGSLGIADEFTAEKGKLAAPGMDIGNLDYARLFDSIQSEEFGHGMSLDELRHCAQFLVALSNKLYGDFNPVKKLWYRHIKHTI